MRIKGRNLRLSVHRSWVSTMKMLGPVSRRSLLLVGVVTLVVAIAGLYFAERLVGAAFEAEYERFRAVQLGMTENQIRALMGEPYKLYGADRGQTDYYIPGYSYEQRRITNKVLIYIGTEAIAYIYLNDADRVEHLFVGGS